MNDYPDPPARAVTLADVRAYHGVLDDRFRESLRDMLGNIHAGAGQMLADLARGNIPTDQIGANSYRDIVRALGQLDALREMGGALRAAK